MCIRDSFEQGRPLGRGQGPESVNHPRIHTGRKGSRSWLDPEHLQVGVLKAEVLRVDVKVRDDDDVL
eukprot:4500459-Alexandrium_andersonii.AAC.1